MSIDSIQIVIADIGDMPHYYLNGNFYHPYGPRVELIDSKINANFTTLSRHLLSQAVSDLVLIFTNKGWTLCDIKDGRFRVLLGNPGFKEIR